jgi:hypothetical protein
MTQKQYIKKVKENIYKELVFNTNVSVVPGSYYQTTPIFLEDGASEVSIVVKGFSSKYELSASFFPLSTTLVSMGIGFTGGSGTSLPSGYYRAHSVPRNHDGLPNKYMVIRFKNTDTIDGTLEGFTVVYK